jgi:hypothetical protein
LKNNVRDPKVILKWSLNFFRIVWKLFGICLVKAQKIRK